MPEPDLGRSRRKKGKAEFGMDLRILGLTFCITNSDISKVIVIWKCILRKGATDNIELTGYEILDINHSNAFCARRHYNSGYAPSLRGPSFSIGIDVRRSAKCYGQISIKRSSSTVGSQDDVAVTSRSGRG